MPARGCEWLHNLAVDSHGNIYTAEADTGKRAQKFTPAGNDHHACSGPPARVPDTWTGAGQETRTQESTAAILLHGCLAALLIFGRLPVFKSIVATLKDTVVNDRLTKDEFDALLHVSRARKDGRTSACVARNAKRLTGLKYFRYGKDGELALTDKGQQTLFLKRCVDALRAIAESGPMPPDTDVTTFLLRKGHIAPGAVPHRYDLTQRGRESLADIELNSSLPSA
jgi:hypothetical protein